MINTARKPMTKELTSDQAKTKLKIDKDTVITANNAVAAWQKRHDALVDSGAAEVVLSASRTEGFGLRDVMEEYRRKVDRDEQLVVQALQAEATNAMDQSWASVERLFRERHTLAAAVQSDLADLIASFAELDALNDRIYAAVPNAQALFSTARPSTFKVGAISSAMEAYLFVHSSAKLCCAGRASYEVEARRDLIDESRELAAMVLSRRSQP